MSSLSRPRLAILVLSLLLAVPAAAAYPFDLGFEGSVRVQVNDTAYEVRVGTRGDASQWDASQWDASQWDGSQWDASQWDGSQWDASQWDASQWDGSQWDASQWDASQWDASQWDAFGGYDAFYAYQWNLRATNVPGAWASFGPGDHSRTICVLDSGVDYTHPDLAPQMWSDPATGAHGYDFVDDDDDPMDVGGHGTHVASIAAARAGDDYGIAGVVNARIMAVRVIGPQGHGTDEDFALGIRWCVDKGAHIVSMSLSTVEPVKLVASAANYAAAHGVLVVSSAGNTHCEECQAPLVKVKGILTVTAMAPNGTVARFATWGPEVDLGAPGVAIPGALPGARFAIASGSSQAVPLVSGIAALAWSKNTSLTAGEIADLLVQSAMTTGQGAHGPLLVVDARAALQLAGQHEEGEAAELDRGTPQLIVDPSKVQKEVPEADGDAEGGLAKTGADSQQAESTEAVARGEKKTTKAPSSPSQILSDLRALLP